MKINLEELQHEAQMYRRIGPAARGRVAEAVAALLAALDKLHAAKFIHGDMQ